MLQETVIASGSRAARVGEEATSALTRGVSVGRGRTITLLASVVTGQEVLEEDGYEE